MDVMTPPLLKPSKLTPGDTIGIVAPCLPILPDFREKYERGKRALQDMGFQLKEGKTTHFQHGYSAGTPKQQADDINAMFADKNVRAIVAASGGYTGISVLEHLDYNLIGHNPKPFIGMSDMTCYQLALYTKVKAVGFHMDEVGFGLGWNWQRKKFENTDEVKKLYSKILMTTEPLGSIPRIKMWEAWRPGAAKGPLIGGNINAMTFQLGTPYFPQPAAFDGAILFWEAVGRPFHDIMRALYQLKYYGVFDRIAGMLVGTVTAVPPAREEGITEPILQEVVLDVSKDHIFPIMGNMDFGHFSINPPMPVGTLASFDTDHLELKLLESPMV
jgi:muramoyltetrapeptide carboxypeptidase